jgi:hypothetical protein
VVVFPLVPVTPAERALDDQRRGAGVERGRRELVAVGGHPPDAEEQRPRPNPAAVEGEIGDLGPGIALDRANGGPLAQLGQVHRGRF